MNNAIVPVNEDTEVLSEVWWDDKCYCVTNSTKIKNICELAHKQHIETKISPMSYISNDVFSIAMFGCTMLLILCLLGLSIVCVLYSGDYWFIPLIYTLAFVCWDRGSKLFKFWYRWCITWMIVVMKTFMFICNRPFITATSIVAGILTYMHL